MKPENNIKAVFWDFDGTLVDTRRKNLNVTRRIIENFTGRPYRHYPVLRSMAAYQQATRTMENWRHLYRDWFKFTPSEIDEAGSLWSEFQLRDKTPMPFFSGIPRVIRALGHLPQAIISQNSSQNILKLLEEQQLITYFSRIIGYEEVELRRQKPEPDGLLQCLNELKILDDEGIIVYVGDHETDMVCSNRANEQLHKKNYSVYFVTIGAAYSAANGLTDGEFHPDYLARKPAEILFTISKLASSG